MNRSGVRFSKAARSSAPGAVSPRVGQDVPMSEAQAHYKRPNWFDRHVMMPAVAGFTRLGLSVWGSRVLEVRGRKSGEPRRVPVNLLTFEGDQYLVAPRGET